jgi:deoxyribodipyrimidine photo-lyase
MTAIWWIRRDLRLTDNAALHASLEAGSVIPVLILDPAFAHASMRRKDFLDEGLHALGKELRDRNSYLVLRSGKPLEVLKADGKPYAVYTPYSKAWKAKLPINM